MKHFIVILVCCMSIMAKAQLSVKGSINLENGEALPYASVLLLSGTDSTLVRGQVSNVDGHFLIETNKAGNYLVSISAVGYKKEFTKPFSLSLNNPLLDLGSIKVAENIEMLKDVVVKAEVPMFEQYIDRTVVNVSNSIIAGGSTALELLEKSPGITVDRQNSSLQLRGKAGVIVQLDGKQTYLSMEDLVNLLSTMPSDNIDKIELITNPSAKYDASGNSGIINIRLKKNNDIGTNGSISMGVGSGRYGRGRGSFQITHRTKRVNLFGNYSANRGGNYFDLKVNQEIVSSNQRNLTDQGTYIRHRDRGQTAKVGLDYRVNKNTTIGATWMGIWFNQGQLGTAESSFKHAENEPYYLQANTDKTLTNNSLDQIVNIYIQQGLGKKGGELSADVDFARFSRQFSNTLLTQISSNGNLQPLTGLITQMPTGIDINTIKVDYNNKLSTKWRLESGIKSSYVFNDNDLTLSSGEANNLVLDPVLSNRFQYEERVNAAYLSIAGKIGTKTDVLAGLRTEHTRSVAQSITTQEEVPRNYINYFPSIFISQALTTTHVLTFSYSYRIDRPNYQFLNPGRSYVDPYLYTRGNAYLKPQFTHSLELKHAFKDKLFTTLGAGFVKDLSLYIVQSVDSIRAERTPLNIGNSQSYNLNISFPQKITKGWNLQTNFLGMFSQFNSIYQNTPITLKQISGRFNASNSFEFGNNWTGELTGWLSTPAVIAVSRSPWLGSMDIGIQKAVGSSLKFKLSVQDVFHSNKFISRIVVPNFSYNGRLSFDTRIVMANIIYSFGNHQLRSSRQHKMGSEDEIKRTNSN